jgi:hypothetical protein
MIMNPNKNVPYKNNYMGIIRKSNQHIIIYLTAFLIAIHFGGFVSMAAEPNENTSRRQVEYFLKKANEKHITQLEVYYMELGIESPIALLENAIRSGYEYKVIVRDPNLAEVTRALREFKYEDIHFDISDFRWGCVFYDNNEEVLRLFFQGFSTVVVNGVGYTATPELVRALMQFLPVKAYKEMNEFIEEQKRRFPSVSPKQKATPNEQKKSGKP